MENLEQQSQEQETETAETQEQVEETTEESTPQTEEEPEKKKKNVEKRISKLTAKIYDLEGRNKAYEQILVQNTQKPKEEAPKQEQPVQEPKFDDFETTEDYTKALVNYESKQIRKTIEQETLQKRQVEEADNRQKTLLRAQDETIKRGFEKFKDNVEEFEEAINTVILPKVNDPKYGLIVESPHSHDIIMHLHRNEDLARDIAGMSTLEAAKKIGAIESKLSAAIKPKKVSEAPKPITPVGDSHSGGTKPVSEMSHSEYRKLRESGKLR